MTEFLVGDALSKRIRDVVAGKDVRCAVAYWGSHGFGASWTRRNDVKIICDIVGGATSPQALKILGAPARENLKHIENLHAKVYISNIGVVIGSANASVGGLGCSKRSARLEEAGVFHNPGGTIWLQSLEWFNDLFGRGKIVDKSALDLAEILYRPKFDGNPTSFSRMNFLSRIQKYPDIFLRDGISFVFSSGQIDARMRENAADQIESANQFESDAEAFQTWDLREIFFKWDDDDIRNLSNRIICFHVGPNEGVWRSAHRVMHRFSGVAGRNVGHFYTERITGSLGPLSFPQTGYSICSGDAKKTLLRAYRKRGNGVFGANEFSKLLTEDAE